MDSTAGTPLLADKATPVTPIIITDPDDSPPTNPRLREQRSSLFLAPLPAITPTGCTAGADSPACTAASTSAEPDVKPVQSFNEDDLLTDLHAFVLRDKLGEGSFGLVFEAACENHEEDKVAVKFQALPDNPDELSACRSELSLLKHMQHENLVAFKGAWFGDCPESVKRGTAADSRFREVPVVAIVMELCSGGSLKDALDTPELKISKRKLMQLSRDLSAGVCHLHSFGIIHRDIKPLNVLLTADWQAKICDYGLCVHQDSHSRLEFYGGTEAYSAPELILAEDYSVSSDIFSLGLTFVEMMTRREIGQDGFLCRSPRDMFVFEDDQVRAAIEASEHGVGAPPSFVELAVQCTDAEPDDRPDAAAVMEWIDDMLRESSFCGNGEEGGACASNELAMDEAEEKECDRLSMALWPPTPDRLGIAAAASGSGEVVNTPRELPSSNNFSLTFKHLFVDSVRDTKSDLSAFDHGGGFLRRVPSKDADQSMPPPAPPSQPAPCSPSHLHPPLPPEEAARLEEEDIQRMLEEQAAQEEFAERQRNYNLMDFLKGTAPCW